MAGFGLTPFGLAPYGDVGVNPTAIATILMFGSDPETVIVHQKLQVTASSLGANLFPKAAETTHSNTQLKTLALGFTIEPKEDVLEIQ